jgi:hypothetical protein
MHCPYVLACVHIAVGCVPFLHVWPVQAALAPALHLPLGAFAPAGLSTFESTPLLSLPHAGQATAKITAHHDPRQENLK